MPRLNLVSAAPERPTRGADIYGHGFSFRKRPILKRFLDAGTRVHWIESGTEVSPGADLYLWGSQAPPAGLPADVRIVRVEDGFLRSVGLGADLTRPLSWIIDRRGIYYDATQPSELEDLLALTDFTPALLARAARLRERLAMTGLTKYNVGTGEWQRPGSAGRVILVPGQVESDASLRFGAPDLRTNMELLRTVRQRHPDAYLIYKPHPDVLAGLRAVGQDEGEAWRWCDMVLTDIPMGKLLDAVDEVHVLTSLAGFEGLLRGRRVVCYGQPFYAGWGLTEDRVPLPRRKRRLELDALVAGALILYPRYLDKTSRRRVAPERAVADLLAWRDSASPEPTLWRSAFRLVLRRVVGVR